MTGEAPKRHSRMAVRDAVLIFASFLALYISFLSIDFDANGVIEAANLDSGVLFSQNHVIYRAVGAALFRIARDFGYAGRSLYVLQWMDAFFGAAGVALAYLAFLELGASRRSGFAAALLWGTSFIYWYYSTDVAYVVMASAFAAAAFVCTGVLRKKGSSSTALLMGLLLALSTLTFQMACFLVPVLLWPIRRRVREVVLCVAVSAVVAGGGYLALAISEGHHTPAEVLRWATSHGSGLIPEWGRLEIGSIPVAASAAARSFQFDVFDRLRELAGNPFHLYMWRLASGAVCFVLLAASTLVATGFHVSRTDSTPIWLGVSYLVFWPFIVWFSPTESYWFLLPNLFVCAAAALVWKVPVERPIGFAFVFGTIAVMGTLTFTSWVWPKHIDPGPVGRKIECIARNVRPHDLVIAPDWYWPAPLSYFHRTAVLPIIDHSVRLNDHRKLIEYMAGEFRATTQNGGRVLIVDPASYSSQYLDWLAAQSSFTREDFDRFPGRFAFQCEDAKFRSITAASDR